MPEDSFRLSDYARVAIEDESLILESREEAGRGKRFGTNGQISLSQEEAERFAKWVFSRELEA